MIQQALSNTQNIIGRENIIIKRQPSMGLESFAYFALFSFRFVWMPKGIPTNIAVKVKTWQIVSSQIFSVASFTPRNMTAMLPKMIIVPFFIFIPSVLLTSVFCVLRVVLHFCGLSQAPLKQLLIVLAGFLRIEISFLPCLCSFTL